MILALGAGFMLGLLVANYQDITGFFSNRQSPGLSISGCLQLPRNPGCSGKDLYEMRAYHNFGV